MMNCTINEKRMPCENLAEYTTYEDRLYSIFAREYKTLPQYDDFNIVMKHFPPTYDEKSGFYHLICENYQHTGNEEDRNPNFSRAEKILWPKFILKECIPNLCNGIKIWENKRHGKTNILIFCTNVDYLIVLSKRRDYLLLTTAYPVEHEHRKVSLLKEYETYKKQTSPLI